MGVFSSASCFWVLDWVVLCHCLKLVMACNWSFFLCLKAFSKFGIGRILTNKSTCAIIHRHYHHLHHRHYHHHHHHHHMIIIIIIITIIIIIILPPRRFSFAFVHSTVTLGVQDKVMTERQNKA